MIINWQKKILILLVFFLAGMFIIGNIKAHAATQLNKYIIDKSNAGEFINIKINQLINEGVKNIYIKNGTYYLNNMININKPDVTIMGEDRVNTKLIQTQSSIDSIGAIKTKNATVEDLTIDNHDKGGAAFVVGNSDYVTLKGCNLYGADEKFFTIYFAGKDYPQNGFKDPVQGLENDFMDTNNSIVDNIIYSKFNGDGVAFAVQKNGLVKNNKIFGSRIALYMCKDSDVEENMIDASSSNGIIISIPSSDNTILKNTITNSKDSGIKVSAELEYPVPKNYYGKNITISKNTIDTSHYIGIEINRLSNSLIESNTINNTYNVGIYLLLADNISTRSNVITNTGYSIDKNLSDWKKEYNSGIFLDYKVINSTIDQNTLINNKFICPLGIKELNGNLNQMNKFINNKIYDKFTYPLSIIHSLKMEAVEILKNEDEMISKLKDENGNEFTTSMEIKYKWYRNGKLIESRNENNYKVSKDDDGSDIKLIVTYDGKELTSNTLKITKDEAPALDAISELKDKNENEVTTGAQVTYEWHKNDKLIEGEEKKYDNVNSYSSSSSGSHRNKETSNSEENSDRNNDKTLSENVIKKAAMSEENKIDTVTDKLNNNNKTGWRFMDGYWFFLENNGFMAKGWHKTKSGEWTYDGKDTVNTWSHLDFDGKMNTGWFKDTDSSWYYLNDNKNSGKLGVMETGWKYINGKWYFLKNSGAMAIGWKQIDGKWYYLCSDGSMASNTIIDTYILDKHGVLIE